MLANKHKLLSSRVDILSLYEGEMLGNSKDDETLRDLCSQVRIHYVRHIKTIDHSCFKVHDVKVLHSAAPTSSWLQHHEQEHRISSSYSGPSSLKHSRVLCSFWSSADEFVAVNSLWCRGKVCDLVKSKSALRFPREMRLLGSTQHAVKKQTWWKWGSVTWQRSLTHMYTWGQTQHACMPQASCCSAGMCTDDSKWSICSAGVTQI